MLTTEQIVAHWNKHQDVRSLGRFVEVEVRKQDEALILQLVEALEKADKISGYPNNRKTITAGRARLEDIP